MVPPGLPATQVPSNHVRATPVSAVDTFDGELRPGRAQHRGHGDSPHVVVDVAASASRPSVCARWSRLRHTPARSIDPLARYHVHPVDQRYDTPVSGRVLQALLAAGPVNVRRDLRPVEAMRQFIACTARLFDQIHIDTGAGTDRSAFDLLGPTVHQAVYQLDRVLQGRVPVVWFASSQVDALLASDITDDDLRALDGSPAHAGVDDSAKGHLGDVADTASHHECPACVKVELDEVLGTNAVVMFESPVSLHDAGGVSVSTADDLALFRPADRLGSFRLHGGLRYKNLEDRHEHWLLFLSDPTFPTMIVFAPVNSTSLGDDVVFFDALERVWRGARLLGLEPPRTDAKTSRREAQAGAKSFNAGVLYQASQRVLVLRGGATVKVRRIRQEATGRALVPHWRRRHVRFVPYGPVAVEPRPTRRVFVPPVLVNDHLVVDGHAVKPRVYAYRDDRVPSTPDVAARPVQVAGPTFDDLD